MNGAQLYAYPTAAAADLEEQTAAGRMVEWLRSKWRAFLQLEPAILNLQHRAAVASYAAQERGDARTAALGKESIERLGELAQLHLRAVASMRTLQSKVPGLSGLGALPLVPFAYVAAVLALGAMVTWIFSRVGAEERIVRLLEAGRLSAEEAERLLHEADDPSAAESFMGFVKVAAGVGLTYVLLRAAGVIR